MRWLWLLWGSLFAHDCAIVFIHLGPELPPYAAIALQQARLFNPDCPLYLAAQASALELFSERGVIPIAVESLARSAAHEEFLRKSPTNGFWRAVVERFFILEELMSQHALERLFHLENDNMLYCDLKRLLPLFRLCYAEQMGVAFDNDSRGIAGFLYIDTLKPLSHFVRFVALRAVRGDNDMALLGQFRKSYLGQWIDHLPVVPPAYAKSYPLVAAIRVRAQRPDDYAKNAEQLGYLFDAAALGQYLGGIDPINQARSGPGFINESALYNPAHLQFLWEQDEAGRRIPVALFQGERFPIANLHIHSKNLAPFSSALPVVPFPSGAS